ncbi:MAG: sialidase family protein [Verrucomicrobiota bacterium]|nr:sialidase family protein [Verrucomicrobiota bacterium]
MPETLKLVADDGAHTIIYNNRAYSSDDGQTWNYYDKPLPADYISYDSETGVFEYTASPNSSNGLSVPSRARSFDGGKTWTEVGFHETLSSGHQFQATWVPEANSTELQVIFPEGGKIQTKQLHNWQVLDTTVFSGNIVLLAKAVQATDAINSDDRRLFVFSLDTAAPLVSVPDNYYDLLKDGFWEFEFRDESMQPFFLSTSTEDPADESIPIISSYTGRARNPIHGLCDVTYYPWINSTDLGWHAFFKANSDTPSAFLWNPSVEWLYTQVGWYPFLWSFKYDNWIWVDAGPDRTHQWYLFEGNNQWQNLGSQ